MDKWTIIMNLSFVQKQELNLRISSFHNDKTIGSSWDEVKKRIYVKIEERKIKKVHMKEMDSNV